jgi:abortive infection bacteriophage resistance protein
MSRKPFVKPATTHGQQLAKLEQRGLIIEDPCLAEFYLKHLNYYRLGAYWLTFEDNHIEHTFKPGARFNDVLNLYIFDRELRLLVLNAIERIEVSVRSQWAYQMGHCHGSHSYLEPSLSRNRNHWQNNLDRLTEEVNRSDETFIRHFANKYIEPLPPVWVVSEVISLGQLSRWYANLKPIPTRSAIADIYGVDHQVLHTWLHHLTTLRNICAHHSRLWNREFTVIPQLPRTKPHGLFEQLAAGSRKIYNTIVMMLCFLDTIAPNHHWRKRLTTLISDHKINTELMGFPPHWEQMPIWLEETTQSVQQ